jgi:hypothetical protein
MAQGDDDFRLGWNTLNTLWNALFTLETKAEVEHDWTDGSHDTYAVPKASGNYVLSGSTYVLRAGLGPLPETISIVSTGVVTLVFTETLPTTDYAIRVTPALDSTGLPGIMSFEYPGSTTTVVAGMIRGDAVTLDNLTGFSIAVYYDA